MRVILFPPAFLRRSFYIINLVTVAGLFTARGFAEISDPNFPHIVQQDGRAALFVDGAPYLVLGAQVNNSSAWPSLLPKVWPAMEFLHVNTVEMPVYWEQIEAARGTFDFSLVDTLVTQAREHKVRLILLWFGTWKNGSAHYRPEWMKRSPELYPNIFGKNGKEVDSPSPLSAAALQLDIKAFTALMQHLKAFDTQHTVIMVQVENETGAWGSVRDYSPKSEKIFQSPVPAELLTALHRSSVGEKSDWQTVFGEDAEEYYHAWFVAHYVGQVAAAGKAVYPLPLYTNAALRDPLEPGRPPKYESGGPTDNVISIWKAASPALDLLAPDIYLPESKRYFRVLELYHRPDNPLLVPETGSSPNYARYFFAALGNGAIGFAPFGLDFTRYDMPGSGPTKEAEERFAPFAANYILIGPMAREIAKLNFDGKLQAVCEPDDKMAQTLSFENWQATVSYGAPRFGSGKAQGNPQPIGRALVAQLDEDQFIVTGFFSRVTFKPSGIDAERPWQFIRVEEGKYVDGKFEFIRIWNGDQTDWGLNFGATPTVLRVTLSTR